MSPVRVTNILGQKKKGIQGAAKEAGKQPSGGVGGSSASEDYALSSSKVYEEFVRIINEAVGLINDGESVSTKPSKDLSTLPVPTASGPSITEARPPRFSVARAKELAAKAQRMKEEREAGEIKPAENPDSTEQPAYQRYHTLAQAMPPGLSLPYHYKILAEMFRSMDTVVAMLYNRSETATFAKTRMKFDLFSLPPLEKALVSLARNTEEKDGEGTKPICSQNPTVPQASISAAAQTPSSLKGVPQSLLDRVGIIRAKEAQKLQAAMTRNPAQEERLLMMSRLGELARILRNVFVAEAKAALIMEVACNRMVASYRSALSPELIYCPLSPIKGEMEKHIRLLAEVAPDWLSIHPVRKDFYLKLNKMVEVSIVLDKLNRRLKEEEGL
ncbi:hypothetical protein GOODEAATRI_018811 [Goodea atripinnis]|uniref:CDT1 Geminin-binding domain-containing protein n=1 Tax=Goodea atripinnis TaxID=208336 RepID=A0ABV0PPS7_9TELE